MKARRRNGVLRVELQANETALVSVLLHDLNAVVLSQDLQDPVVRRLYPDGYADDATAAQEFRELVTDSLRTDRTSRIAECIAELPVDGGRMELDPAAADRWLRVLNDLRLALGTRLGVSEEEELDLEQEQAAVYHWLGAVQETLVQRLMR